MSKKTGASFSRRAPDSITEELVAVLSSRASFEFKALFDIIFSWIPFFFFCFPVPKFSAKPPEAPALPLP